MTTLLVLAPLVRPGYVLRYDMVFVPRQPLRWDLIVAADGLPRAVPQDALVSLLSSLVPGWLLQRVVLVAIVWLAVVGAGRLVPARRELTRLVAAIGYGWTPFLAERLLLGQWGLLLAYAALPWLVRATIGVREGRSGALPRLILAAAVAAVTPTGGLLALVTVLVLLAGRRVGRHVLAAWAAVVALNLPWVLAAVVTAAGGRSAPIGVAAFAARGENWGGPLVALAGTGGIWNALTTPASRESPLVPVVTGGLLLLAVIGFPVLRARWPAGCADRVGLLAVGSFLGAAVAVLPGGQAALRWLVAEVPGGGLVRDGQKLLVPYALCLVLCAALGGERVASRLAPPRDRLVLVGLLLLPIAVLPDLAHGAAGRLQPARYPQEWAAVRAVVAADPGPTLALPMSMYRAYRWNRDTVVIDPLARYLPAEVVTDDVLVVGDLVVPGESGRVSELRDALAHGRSLAGTELRWVVVQHRSGGTLVPGVLDGLTIVHSGPELTLYRNPTSSAPAPPPVGRWLAVMGLCVALIVVISAAGSLLRRPTAW